MDTRTVHQQSYQAVHGDRYETKRPQDNIPLREGDLVQSFQSAYGKDFASVHVPCYAGPLVDSALHDHRPTSKYLFTTEKEGHHFYKEVDG